MHIQDENMFEPLKVLYDGKLSVLCFFVLCGYCHAYKNFISHSFIDKQ